jgi:hypothetical protein
MLRTGQITQTVETQVHERPSRQKLIRDQLVSRAREQNLAAVTDPHQPGGTVQRRTEPVPIALFGLAGVDGDASPDAPERPPVLST